MPSLLPQLASGHRQRLLGAMAEAVREDGLENVTVAAVVARARTSRRTFYEHFSDREECFLELFDLVGERLIALIAEAASSPGEA
jgi:AcrR family transcriptional regulator